MQNIENSLSDRYDIPLCEIVQSLNMISNGLYGHSFNNCRNTMIKKIIIVAKFEHSVSQFERVIESNLQLKYIINILKMYL